MRNGDAERTVFFSARNTTPTCIGAADVSQFSNRNNLRRICKTRCAARRNGEKIGANSCVIDANFGKVLRMSDRRMSALSTSHAPATRRRNLAASECFCSDAGRSFGALRVDRAENLQRIRAFSSGHFAQWRCRTHGFFRRATRRRLALEVRRRRASFKSKSLQKKPQNLVRRASKS